MALYSAIKTFHETNTLFDRHFVLPSFTPTARSFKLRKSRTNFKVLSLCLKQRGHFFPWFSCPSRPEREICLGNEIFFLISNLCAVPKNTTPGKFTFICHFLIKRVGKNVFSALAVVVIKTPSQRDTSVVLVQARTIEGGKVPDKLEKLFTLQNIANFKPSRFSFFGFTNLRVNDKTNPVTKLSQANKRKQ